jgi:hypothetical protein
MDRGKYAALLGPVLLIGGASVPERQRALRVLLLALGGVGTAYSVWREYARSVK